MRWLDTVFFGITPDFISPVSPRYGESVEITLRVAKDHSLEKVFFRFAPDGEETLLEMRPTRADHFFQYFSVRFVLKWPQLRFRFLLLTSDSLLYWYNHRTISTSTPLDLFDFQCLVDFQGTEWVPEAVFYQIFPDRFHNGNPQRNYQDQEYAYGSGAVRVRNWGDSPLHFAHGYGLDFFNGDLDGVLQKIDYFQRLGITALYFNPIFTAPSNHRYDIQDYFAVDPHLGDAELFSQLTQEFHQRGIRIMLDGIINHSGVASRWFNALNWYDEPGAYNAESSPYDDFYIFYQHPEQYEMWLGIPTLPKLNYRSEKLRNMVYRDADSVLKYWLKSPFSIDGWRFDVANMTARQEGFQGYLEVWREIRQELKALNPEAYLMGEHFFDGTDLLQGDCLDGNMNYQGFYFPVIRWLSEQHDFRADTGPHRLTVPRNAHDFVSQIQDFMSRLPLQIVLRMFNFLNSHDRPRLISLLQGNTQRLLTAMYCLFTFPGTPSVYYGDEIGLEGGPDPDNRRCMVWDEAEWNEKLFQRYQQLIQFRSQSEALQRGNLQWLLTTSNTVVYARFTSEETWVVVLSKDALEAQLEIPVWILGKLHGTAVSALDNQPYPFAEGLLCVPEHSELLKI